MAAMSNAREDKREKTVNISHLLSDEGEKIYDQEDWVREIDKFYNRLFKGDKAKLRAQIRRLRSTVQERLPQGHPPRHITMEMLEDAISLVKPNRMGSPGDGIMPEMVALFTTNFKETLLQAFNRYLWG